MPDDGHGVESHALLPIARRPEDSTDVSLSDDEDWEMHAKPKESWVSPRLLVLFALLLAFSLITFIVALTRKPKPVLYDGISRRPNNGYILDPNFDSAARPTTRHYHWTVQDTVRNPDGVYRPMILINGEFPGPLIECNLGDTLTIHVENKATNATSIHWHGLYQNGSNLMDGTVGTTQCPIAPGAEFVYNFTINGQSGTYWYHAHHSLQASDGLFGPLIVHASNEGDLQPMSYSTDRVVMVGDHYYDLSSELLMTYLEPDRENAEPVPDSALINGMGVRDCSALPNRKCDNSSLALETFLLWQNRNHRLRFINVGAFAEFQIQIDEHDFAVTEIDGTDVAGDVRYHRLNILPAQRYSIILTTNNTNAESFWLRARMVTTCFAEENPELEPEVRAVIQYTELEGANRGTSPSSKDWSEVVELECRDLNISQLHPTMKVSAPVKADTVIQLRSNFEIGDWRLSRGFINSTSHRPNIRSPSLYRTVDGLKNNNESFIAAGPPSAAFVNSKAFDPKRELVYQTTGIQTIDIIISNFDDGAHPFHLHGYKFWILASGSGYYDPAINSPSPEILENPMRRDTATVEAFGWVLLRFVADNPGMWAFHCHVSWHSEAGLLMQFLTRSEELRGWDVPTEQRELCKLDGAEKGKGPDDSIWFGNSG